MKYYFWVLAILSLASFLGSSAEDEQCGSQAGFAVCPDGLCCSKYGYCGTTSAYCCSGCQSQCNCGSSPPPPPPPTPPPPTTPLPPPPSGGDGVESIINSTLFDQMLPYRNDARCPAHGFYTYDAFIAAAKAYGAFGTTGDLDTKKREIAAFLAQTSHETTGGWPGAPDGPYAWGYCYLEEVSDQGPHCVPSTEWPCAPNQRYYGRGPIQISYNYNYGPAGLAIGSDLLNNPGLVATDPVVSFKTAFWFWMTPQPPKPSCHDVITGQWTPSAADEAAGRVPGFGLTTNIINGGLECGHGYDDRVADRIGFYMKYCDMLGVSYGSNLDCYSQPPFGNEMLNIIDVLKVGSYSPN